MVGNCIKGLLLHRNTFLTVYTRDLGIQKPKGRWTISNKASSWEISIPLGEIKACNSFIYMLYLLILFSVVFKNTVSHVQPKHLMRQMKPYCFAVTKFKPPFYLINTLIQISIQRTNKFLLSDIETKATSLAKGFWRAPKLLKVGITDGRILILSTLKSHFLNYLIRSVSIHTACYLLKWLNQKGYLLIQSVNISKPKVLCVTFSPFLSKEI